MAVTSPERRFLLGQSKTLDMFGFSEKELTGMDWVNLTHPEDIQEDVRLLNQTLSGETDGYKMEKRFIRSDGQMVYASISARCVRQDDGTVDHLVLIVEDTTQRKQAEEELGYSIRSLSSELPRALRSWQPKARSSRPSHMPWRMI